MFSILEEKIIHSSYNDVFNFRTFFERKSEQK